MPLYAASDLVTNQKFTTSTSSTIKQSSTDPNTKDSIYKFTVKDVYGNNVSLSKYA